MLSFRRIVRIAFSGVRYRLFRATITVAVIAIAMPNGNVEIFRRQQTRDAVCPLDDNYIIAPEEISKADVPHLERRIFKAVTVGMLQVADSTVDHLEAMTRGASAEVTAFDDRDRQTAQ